MTATKLRRVLDEHGFDHGDLVMKAAEVMSKDGVLRNACIFGESDAAFCIASIDESRGGQHRITVSVLSRHPFAIFECKRVGVEEGMKKGPQSIEKAKQGARFLHCKKSACEAACLEVWCIARMARCIIGHTQS